ncbi:MAG: FAD-dependent monooxygenase [Clostridia bacterium]|nr:FAD-dependent monooxygenase [Clostridia bacterium]
MSRGTPSGDPVPFLVRNLSVSYTDGEEAALAAASRVLRRALGRDNVPRIREMRVFRRSVDARKKPDVRLVYSVLVRAECSRDRAERDLAGNRDVSLFEEQPLSVPRGIRPMQGRPVIVGCGPAGLFAALLLAESGMKPILLERGDDPKRRSEAVDRFLASGLLDPSSNIQFGAGGAGMFSDGKLMTRIGDPMCGYVLRRFAEFGAGESVLTEAKPHVGTDVLTGVVDRICRYLTSLGCELRFRCQVTGLVSREGGTGRSSVCAVRTVEGDIPCGAVVLAIGHSARDTCSALRRNGMEAVCKPFSVGVRIEHLQSKINEAAYGSAAKATAACGAAGPDLLLPPAEYAVSRKETGETAGEEPRGVYSFCMCPGGEVIAAASEEGGVVTNGMSRSARDGRNANAALAVSVLPSDYGSTVEGAVAFQRSLEQGAYRLGGGDFRAPVQTVGSFLGTASGQPGEVLPTYRGGEVTLCDLHSLLPPFVSSLLEEGIRAFDRQLPGFADPSAVLTGAETRTSSPWRLLRGTDGVANGFENVYPAGEGAGYAGGITSAAVDGLRAAIQILSIYRPSN